MPKICRAAWLSIWTLSLTLVMISPGCGDDASENRSDAKAKALAENGKGISAPRVSIADQAGLRIAKKHPRENAIASWVFFDRIKERALALEAAFTALKSAATARQARQDLRQLMAACGREAEGLPRGDYQQRILYDEISLSKKAGGGKALRLRFVGREKNQKIVVSSGRNFLWGRQESVDFLAMATMLEVARSFSFVSEKEKQGLSLSVEFIVPLGAKPGWLLLADLVSSTETLVGAVNLEGGVVNKGFQGQILAVVDRISRRSGFEHAAIQCLADYRGERWAWGQFGFHDGLIPEREVAALISHERIPILQLALDSGSASELKVVAPIGLPPVKGALTTVSARRGGLRGEAGQVAQLIAPGMEAEVAIGRALAMILLRSSTAFGAAN